MSLARLTRTLVQSTAATQTLPCVVAAAQGQLQAWSQPVRSFAAEHKVQVDLEHEKNETKESAGFFKDAIKATAYTVKQKAGEALETRKPVHTTETQEPAGTMENKNPDEPVERVYERLAKRGDDTRQGSINKQYPAAAASARSTSGTAKQGDEDQMQDRT